MSNWCTYEEYEKLVKELPKGTRIELDFMDDSMSPPVGTMGTVYEVDSNGVIRVSWDNGQSLGLIPNIDRFHVVE